MLRFSRVLYYSRAYDSATDTPLYVALPALFRLKLL
jgi:hypothetical protein